MKTNQIKVGGRYEIKAGRSTTVVKVKSVNKKTGGWKCQTVNGKIMNVAAPDRFVKEVTPEKKQEPDRKPTLKEMTEAKGITVIPRGRRATSTMRDLDDPTFTRKHHVKDGVLILEADDEEKQKHLGPKPLGQLSALSAAHRVLTEAGRPLTIREIMETALAKNYCVLNGKTIFNTFNGGIRKEIKAKGDESRFVWDDKGLFAAR